MSGEDDLFNTGSAGTKMTPEHVQKMLAKDGIEVTLEQAPEILKFLYMVSDIAMHVYFDALPKPPSSSADSNRSK
jgi:hypothetical protein